MKTFLIKISSIFFLTILLAGNIAGIHAYFHEQTDELNHLLEGDDNDCDDEETPCDICLTAFNLNNLDYNNTPEFSFNCLIHKQLIPTNTVGYIEILQKQLYFTKNRNKAPPYFI